MKELLDALEAQGFKLPSLVLDGSLMRFGDKKSQWFIGWLHHLSKTGQEFIVAEYGDWRSSEEFQYKSGISISREDRSAIDKKMAEMKTKRETAKREEQEKVSGECETLWSNFADGGTSLYLEKKKITGLYGARIHDFNLRVPMRDIEGKLWGIQTVLPSGQKYFTGGQRIEGCFHQIGVIENEVFICEGFATAASIHLATQKPVVAAFNAGNLKSVATAIRKKYPSCAIILCGDDDEWTKDNPGKTKATEAATASLGKVVLPQFADKKTHPTDFNDLHCLEGVEEVRRQVLRVEPEKFYIIPLGYNLGDYYFVSNKNQQIQTLSRSGMKGGSLLSIQPLEYWEALAKNPRGGVNWDKIASDLMDQCHTRGIFSPEKIRGSGVWSDKGRVVINLGNRLYYDGGYHALHRNNLRSNFLYEQARTMPDISTEPLTLAECDKLKNPLALIRFEKEFDWMLLGGWLTIAPVCGALPWRPHIWLTGGSGTGKSYLMNDFIYKIVRDFSDYFLGGTTEPGIRQVTGSNSRPIIFDEFETNDFHSGERVGSILELVRQASSETEASIAKGTVTGEAMRFKPRFCGLFTSVRVNLKHEEDRNRFMVLGLKRHDAGGEHFARLSRFVDQIDAEYVHRLYARTISKMDVLLANVKTLQRVLRDKVTARVAQQYAPILAGYRLLESDDEISEADALALVKMVLPMVNEATLETSDETNALDHIIQSKMTVESGMGIKKEKSVLEIIQDARHDSNANDLLQRNGLMVDGESLFIMNRFKPLAVMFEKTKWSGGYSKSLQRVIGSESRQKVFPLLGVRGLCTIIPLNAIFQK